MPAKGRTETGCRSRTLLQREERINVTQKRRGSFISETLFFMFGIFSIEFFHKIVYDICYGSVMKAFT